MYVKLNISYYYSCILCAQLLYRYIKSPLLSSGGLLLISLFFALSTVLISTSVGTLVRRLLAVPLLRTGFTRRGKIAIALNCSSHRQHNNRPYDSLQKTFANREIVKYKTRHRSEGYPPPSLSNQCVTPVFVVVLLVVVVFLCLLGVRFPRTEFVCLVSSEARTVRSSSVMSRTDVVEAIKVT